MKAHITSPINPLENQDEYSIHLIPESDNDSKLLSALFEKMAIKEDGLSYKKNRDEKIYYERTEDGAYTTKLEITIVTTNSKDVKKEIPKNNQFAFSNFCK